MISFIIPAHNEEELIGLAIANIKSVAAETGETHEVIVANDASTDRTEEIARRHGARVVNLSRRQIAAARNAGAKGAVGELLFFVDADTMVTADAVREAVRALRRGAVGGGSCVRFDGPVPFYAVILDYAFRMLLPLCGLAPGCFLFCTRQAYLRAGGFDETLFVTEEVRFAQRLKRLGRFVLLREYVVTSARKLRTRSALDLLRIGIRLALSGQQSLRRREGLEYWYGPRGQASLAPYPSSVEPRDIFPQGAPP
jgi:glycosyltransferase involved in cell wall biosynthesis